MRTALIYLMALVTAEMATVASQPMWGIVGHVLIFSAILVHSSFPPRKLLVLSLSLIPLVRIISLTVPIADLPQMWWYPIIYTPLLAATIVAIRIMGYKREDIGATIKLSRTQLAIGLTGIGFGVVEYLILHPEPLVPDLNWQTLWLPAFILVVTTGFTEELIFRGVLQRAAVETLGNWRGIVYVSFLFALLHVGFLSWADVAFVFAIAMFFGWVVKKTGTLSGVTISHGLTNIMLFIVAPSIF